MDLQCLTNLFGITRKACNCFDAGLIRTEGSGEEEVQDSEWYKKSKSDYYLDELIGIISMWQTAKSATCNESLAEIYTKAYTIALRDTKKDVLKAIHGRFIKTDRDFTGSLGTKAFTRAVDITGEDYAGIYLNMVPIVDGVMYLNEVVTMFEEDNEFDVLVYKRYVSSNSYELVDTIEGVLSVANRTKINKLVEPLILPMYDDTDGELEYFIIYESLGKTPKNNMPLCGQCGKVEAKAGYFVRKYGTRGSDIESLGSWANTSAYAYGLSLNVDFKCEAESLICRMFSALPQWADAYAGAALLKAGIAVHNFLLTSPEVTRANLLNLDNAEAQMNVWEADYQQTLTWLSQNVDPSVNDCYVCNNSNLKVTQVLL